MQELRREQQRNLHWSERLSDRITAFAGSMTFVAIHLVVYGLWIVVNLVEVPGIPQFDPSLVMLAMAASVEAIFLSTFVLISQNRMMREAARQAELDLQVSLLTEHELTRLVRMVNAIAKHLDVRSGVEHELEEIEKDIAPEAVMDEIDARKVE